MRCSILSFCGKDKYRINLCILNQIKHKLMPNPRLWPTHIWKRVFPRFFRVLLIDIIDLNENVISGSLCFKVLRVFQCYFVLQYFNPTYCIRHYVSFACGGPFNNVFVFLFLFHLKVEIKLF